MKKLIRVTKRQNSCPIRNNKPDGFQSPSSVPRLTYGSRAEEDPEEVDDPEDGQDSAEDLDADVDLQAEERLEAGHLDEGIGTIQKCIRLSRGTFPITMAR